MIINFLTDQIPNVSAFYQESDWKILVLQYTQETNPRLPSPTSWKIWEMYGSFTTWHIENERLVGCKFWDFNEASKAFAEEVSKRGKVAQPIREPVKVKIMSSNFERIEGHYVIAPATHILLQRLPETPDSWRILKVSGRYATYSVDSVEQGVFSNKNKASRAFAKGILESRKTIQSKEV